MNNNTTTHILPTTLRLTPRITPLAVTPTTIPTGGGGRQRKELTPKSSRNLLYYIFTNLRGKYSWTYKAPAAINIHKTLKPKCWDVLTFTPSDRNEIKIPLESTALILAFSYMDILTDQFHHLKHLHLPIAKYAFDNGIPLISALMPTPITLSWGTGYATRREMSYN